MAQSINTFDPLKKVGEAQYGQIWQKLFSTILLGFWGRFFFVACILLALFFGMRRRDPRLATIFLGIAVMIAFGAGVLKALHIA